ncbi:MAG TPA: sulfur carrier protein ThiS [Dissulfurispiraceae bacterium]|nr:sulfur carrier protein ThiS [Dissulfurispiraceae bacterium]
MNIKVNGKDMETSEVNLGGLLASLQIMPERVAVEVNLKIIRKADHHSYKLCEGDVIEIVNFVGGG